jgi:hypothetical protein
MLTKFFKDRWVENRNIGTLPKTVTEMTVEVRASDHHLNRQSHPKSL